MFLVRPKLSITVYLFLVLYRSTSLQSLSVLKNIETFLCKQKLVNNCSIPSMQQPYNHDSFTKYLLQPYSNDSFSKNIENFLCKQKLVNDRSIPSMHAERQITILSVKHSFTLSLSQPLQIDRMTNRGTNTLTAHWLEELFFQLCCCVSFLLWWEIGFGFTYLRTLLNNLFYKLIFF